MCVYIRYVCVCLCVCVGVCVCVYTVCVCVYMCVSHHRLQRGPRPQGPSQVSQHRQVPLLDQVVPAAHLQLAPQVGRGVEVLTVLPGAATLGGEGFS